MLIDPPTREARPIPDAAMQAARDLIIELPEHGRPRTIDLGSPRLDVAYEALSARLTDDDSDPMSRRMEWTVRAAECDQHGWLSDARDMMFGAPRRMDSKAVAAAMREGRMGPMTFSGGDGRRFGWASLETRSLKVSQPRVGDRLCLIGGEIGLLPKVRHSRRWVFNLTTGALASLSDNVNIVLDLDARRSIEIPPEHRSRLERRYAPEFA